MNARSGSSASRPKMAKANPLGAPALVKHPKQHADGRSFIGIGEDWQPGLEPYRIIIGPEADKDIGDILPLFSNPPIIIDAEFPIRRT